MQRSSLVAPDILDMEDQLFYWQEHLDYDKNKSQILLVLKKVVRRMSIQELKECRGKVFSPCLADNAKYMKEVAELGLKSNPDTLKEFVKQLEELQTKMDTEAQERAAKVLRDWGARPESQEASELALDAQGENILIAVFRRRIVRPEPEVLKAAKRITQLPSETRDKIFERLTAMTTTDLSVRLFQVDYYMRQFISSRPNPSVKKEVEKALQSERGLLLSTMGYLREEAPKTLDPGEHPAGSKWADSLLGARRVVLDRAAEGVKNLLQASLNDDGGAKGFERHRRAGEASTDVERQAWASHAALRVALRLSARLGGTTWSWLENKPSVYFTHAKQFSAASFTHPSSGDECSFVPDMVYLKYLKRGLRLLATDVAATADANALNAYVNQKTKTLIKVTDGKKKFREFLAKPQKKADDNQSIEFTDPLFGGKKCYFPTSSLMKTIAEGAETLRKSSRLPDPLVPQVDRAFICSKCRNLMDDGTRYLCEGCSELFCVSCIARSAHDRLPYDFTDELVGEPAQ